MSFATDVRKELAAQTESGAHCRKAMLYAILSESARLEEGPDGTAAFSVASEHEELRTKCFTLLQKNYNINGVFDQNVLVLSAENAERMRRILEDAAHYEPEKDCCARTFLRGTFLCAGSVSDPDKGYHLEYIAQKKEAAERICKVLSRYELHSKVLPRRKAYMVYLKDSAEIIDALNLMGAHAGLMRMENSRILKEVRNSVNRRVNCETANIGKTVTAARKQIEDIELLQREGVLERLPESLVEIALLRQENEELPLSELGRLAHPPVGKSGVNHRLRRLSELADKIREERP